MGRIQRIMEGGMYRSRKGMIFGVCRGIAEYFDFSLFWIRAILLILLVSTGFMPIGLIYLIAALLMKPEPVIPLEDDDEREFYNSYTYSQKSATGRIRRRYDNLERRIRRIENVVTSREFEFDQKINS